MRARLLTREFADLYGMRTAPWITSSAPIAESSKWAASRKPADIASSAICAACRDDKAWFDIIEAPCGDSYCIDCLSDLFNSAMKDESLYPPRCCGQNIPFQQISALLEPTLAKEFDAKRAELDTKDRTYCYEPSCSTFITADGILEEVAACPSCARTTCTICKEAAHAGDCPNDTEKQRVVELAQVEGWQRCYSCRRFVELEMGCNHITKQLPL
ncbi:hypothetical protein ANO11243_042210 [Dothideomycetidae sp. 11243]|nr:hypothetical protein ANO11243_042210 [fungal sp. No.11243]